MKCLRRYGENIDLLMFSSYPQGFFLAEFRKCGTGGILQLRTVRYTVNKEYAEFRKCGISAELGKIEYMEFRKCGICGIP